MHFFNSPDRSCARHSDNPAVSLGAYHQSETIGSKFRTFHRVTVMADKYNTKSLPKTAFFLC